MWVDTFGNEALAVIVEIDPPRVRGAVVEVLEYHAGRMDAIDAAVADGGIEQFCPRPAHVRQAGPPMSRSAATSVTLKPWGTRIPAAACSGGSGAGVGSAAKTAAEDATNSARR